MKLQQFLITILILFSFSFTSNGQKSDSTKFQFSIEQVIQPGPNPIYSYKIKRNKIILFKEPVIFGLNTGFRIRKSSDKLKAKDLNSILTILKMIDKSEYKSSYWSPVLDGVSWYVSIDYLDKKTDFELHNYKLEEIGAIMNIINTSKVTKGIIRFDILDL